MPLADRIEAFQIRVTIKPGLGGGLHHGLHMEKEIITRPVDPPQQIEENGKMIVQPRLESLPLRRIHLFGKRLVQTGEQPRKGGSAFAGSGCGIGIGNHGKQSSGGGRAPGGRRREYARKRGGRKRLGTAGLECAVQFPSYPEETQQEDEHRDGGPVRPKGDAVFEGARFREGVDFPDQVRKLAGEDEPGA